MTVAPKYPLAQSHSGENPFDIVDSPYGQIERWRAQALQTGELGAMTVLNKQLRSDSAAVLDSITEREEALTAREEACDAREKAHAVSVSNFVDFVGKASVLFDRLQQAKADAENSEPLPLPPGHKSELPEPTLELEDTAHLPHDPAIDDETSSATQSALPAPPADPGDPHVPGEFPRLNRPITRDQDEPPAGGEEFPNPELPKPPEQQPQIAAGLDKDGV